MIVWGSRSPLELHPCSLHWKFLLYVRNNSFIVLCQMYARSSCIHAYRQSQHAHRLFSLPIHTIDFSSSQPQQLCIACVFASTQPCQTRYASILFTIHTRLEPSFIHLFPTGKVNIWWKKDNTNCAFVIVQTRKPLNEQTQLPNFIQNISLFLMYVLRKSQTFF